MPIKRRGDWFSQQKNEVIRRISWYWFVQPESPSSISIKLYPHEAYSKYYKNGRIKNFTYYRVSTHKRAFTRKGKVVEIKDGYKDITPESYFDILPASKNINNYNLKERILNLNFLFDYLQDNKIPIYKREKKILKEFLNKSEIRKFIFDWNKYKNEEMSYSPRKIEVYDFKRDLVDAIITFLRCIRKYQDDEIMLRYIFDREITTRYFEILVTVKEFLGYNLFNNSNHNKRRFSQMMKLLTQFDLLSDREPILFRREPAINHNTTDKKEKAILKFLEKEQGYKSYKKLIELNFQKK